MIYNLIAKKKKEEYYNGKKVKERVLYDFVSRISKGEVSRT